MERIDRPMVPTHLHRPKKHEPTIQQKIRQAQTASTKSRNKTVTLKPLPDQFKKDA